MQIQVGSKTLTFGALGIGITLFAIVLLAAGGIKGWEYTNSDEFCSVMCHNVHPEEIAAHDKGPHSRVHCVECHMGRTSTLHLMALKPTHVKELWGMIAGYERPIASSTLRPSREACESCHYPSVEQHDSIDVKVHYADDEQSTESRTTLVLHTGMEAVRSGYTKGIHWHIQNQVRFVSPDPQRREIPWVEVTKSDGSKVTYIDSATKLTPQQISALEARPMVCYDCHNQVGHPFTDPANLVDKAIFTGRIDRRLPNTKARAVALIEKLPEISGETEDRAKRIDALIADDAKKAASGPEFKAAEQKFETEMRKILLDSSFHEKGFSWKSFPLQTGHAETPGCFRCHDGKHFNEKGEVIRLQCTLCHALPQVTRENGKGSVPSLVPEKAGEKQPESHQRANFMRTHADDVGPECEQCHGTPLKRGKSGGSFCSNPACHGRDWPGVDTSANPPKSFAPIKPQGA